MARCLPALGATLALLLVAPAAAPAAQRWAEPNGNVMGACPREDPCDLQRAVNNAGPDDEVIITPGDYGSPTAPLPGPFASAQPGVDVHGEDGQPRPRIFVNSANNDESSFALTGGDVTAHHFEVHQSTTFGSRQAAFVISDGVGSDLVVRTTALQGKACVVLNDSLLTNTLCEATAPQSRGITTYLNVGPGDANNSVLRNVTAIAPSTASYGILAFAGNEAEDVQQLRVTNAIARGGSADVGAHNAGSGSATVTIDHSNFGFESWEPQGGGDRVIDGPGGGNQRFRAVDFAEGFHQAPTAITIDAGATSADNGPVDFDGDPRALGAGTDIGADEFVPPPGATTQDPGAVTASTAAVSGAVNPKGVATSYHFEYGPTTEYGSSTPATDAGAGTAESPASATLTGLAASTTYHYRIVATSRGGTTAGEDRTVTTHALGTGGLLSLSLSPRTFAAAARGASVQALPSQRRRARVGTTVTFALGAPATVRFRVQRARPGRRVRGRCVKPTRRNRRARRCTRFVAVRGGFSEPGPTGQTSFRFTGRVGGRKLRPGRYRLVGSALGGRRRVRFKIVRR